MNSKQTQSHSATTHPDKKPRDLIQICAWTSTFGCTLLGLLLFSLFSFQLNNCIFNSNKTTNHRNIRKLSFKTIHSHTHLESVHFVWSRFYRLSFKCIRFELLFIGTRIFVATILFWILQLRILRSPSPFLRLSLSLSISHIDCFSLISNSKFRTTCYWGLFFFSFAWYSFHLCEPSARPA